MSARDREIHRLCPACGGQEHAYERTVRESSSGERFSIHQCHSCSLRFIADPPSVEESKQYYRGEAAARMHQFGDSMYHRCRSVLMGFDLKRLLQQLDPEDAIVDYGAGDGTVSAFLHRRGGAVIALDMYASDRWPHRDLPYRQCDLNGTAVSPQDLLVPVAHGESRPPKAVVMRHVLEHLYEPRRVLSVIRDAGCRYVLVIVPNYRSRLRPLCGEYWYHWDPPRHLFHFSKSSLVRLAESCGYTAVRIDTYGIDEIISSLYRYILVKGGRHALAQLVNPHSAWATLSSCLAWPVCNTSLSVLLRRQ